MLNKYLAFSQRSQQKFILNKLSKYELGNTLYPILLTLDSAEKENNKKLGQNEIARRLNINKSLITKSVKTLTSNGYVEIYNDPTNKSKKLLQLTKKGKELIPEIRNILDEWRDIFLENFTEEEKNILEKLMEKAYLNIIDKF
nr:winged helix DNA-binding protein [uncultured Cetobacterium sp.]